MISAQGELRTPITRKATKNGRHDAGGDYRQFKLARAREGVARQCVGSRAGDDKVENDQHRRHQETLGDCGHESSTDIGRAEACAGGAAGQDGEVIVEGDRGRKIAERSRAQLLRGGIVSGKEARYVEVDDAMDHIAGCGQLFSALSA
jgi:hypothetical protein